MEHPEFEICSRPDKGGNPGWQGILRQLERGGLVTIDGRVTWTTVARPFVLHFLARANAQRESYGYFTLSLWNSNEGIFKEAPNYEISRQNGQYMDGTPRFTPFNLAEYIFRLNRYNGAGDRLLENCLTVANLRRNGPIDALTVVLLEAVVEGVRAGGKAADQHWAKYQKNGTGIEEQIEQVIRDAIHTRFKKVSVKPKWLERDTTTGLEQGDIVMIAAIDGFRMFKRHIPYWCIAVGAGRWENDAAQPIIGVVFHPPTQEMFIGIVGGGAVLVNERLSEFQSLSPEGAEVPAKAVIATHFSMESPGQSLPLLKNILRDADVHKDTTERVLMLGSGQLALAYVAAQRAQVFINATTPYRSAFAGAAIVEAALGKGMVTDLHNKPWTRRSAGIIAWGGLAARDALKARVDACIP